MWGNVQVAIWHQTAFVPHKEVYLTFFELIYDQYIAECHKLGYKPKKSCLPIVGKQTFSWELLADEWWNCICCECLWLWHCINAVCLSVCLSVCLWWWTFQVMEPLLVCHVVHLTLVTCKFNKRVVGWYCRRGYLAAFVTNISVLSLVQKSRLLALENVIFSHE